MKLTAQLRLLPDPAQRTLLTETLNRANAACNRLSEYAFANGVFQQFSLHRACYHATRAEFNLSAQVVVRAIAKVSASYKLDRKVQRVFRPTGAFPFDERILKFYPAKQAVSIWTVDGRQRIPFVCGERQRQMLQHQQGESDLVLHRGEFYLLAACEIEEPDLTLVDDALGVDLGVANLATDSDGETFTGAGVEQNRQWYAGRRKALQSVGTRSAKRRLKQLGSRQARFQRDTNHIISKRLVQKAQDTKRAIVLEDLGGIGSRTTVQRGQRARRSNWAFAQLGSFIGYKAKLSGVQVLYIDPAYTSQTCSACGYCAKQNRKSQSVFLCVSCGHGANADVNASLNIRARGVVNLPMVCGLLLA